jgi:hypothetical protein
MTVKGKIKIIKKNEQRPAAPAAAPTERATAREMVTTVSTWVNDFQQRRRDETKQALELLFSQQSQPTSV